MWESDTVVATSSSNSQLVSGSGSGSDSGGLYTNQGTLRMAGVSGILRKEQEMWESTDKSLQDAFQDLNALMVMWFVLGDMEFVGICGRICLFDCLENRECKNNESF